MENGIFVISLDYELMWGGIEIWSEDGYGQSNIANVPEVIKRLTDLFAKYQVKATFATVGMIMQKDLQDAKNAVPADTPSYNNKSLSPYGEYMNHVSNSNLYFAPDTVSLLKSDRNVEIGTHTYCHYYCWEEGQDIKQFENDIMMAKDVAEKNSIVLKSIVFPRNQVSSDYLDVCKRHGIKIYRGNALKYFDTPKRTLDNYRQKICRLLDAYFNIAGATSYSLDAIHEGDMLNIRASRFLRPYSHSLRHFESLRLKRIKNELSYAAKHNEIYHLWFHPHNFGANMEQNLRLFESILEHYAQCRDKYGMKSMTMGDFENI